MHLIISINSENHFLFLFFVCGAKMKIIISIEGYTLTSGFIIKEICYIYQNGEYNHYLIRNPERPLTENERRTVRYTTQHLNNLDYFEGDIPYTLIPSLLSHLRDYKLYTYSDIAVKVLQSYLPTTSIENIQDQGYKMPCILPNPGCFKMHNPRYCAKSKALKVKRYLGF